MKHKKDLFLYLLLSFLLCGTWFSCKKSDSIYYNYENDLKQFNGSALDYLNAQKGVYDSLLLVISRLPALKDSLANQKLTVFAVTNESFKIAVENLNNLRKKSNKKPLYLATMNISQLDTMTSKYLVRGKYTTADFQNFADGLLLKSIQYNYTMHIQYNKADASGIIGGGPSIITFTDPKNSIFVRYWQSTPTNAVNIKTNNAVINVVSPSHDFGFGDFVTRVNQ